MRARSMRTCCRSGENWTLCDRAASTPRAVAAELLVRLGIVRSKSERLGEGLVRLRRAAILREQLGGAHARIEGRWLESERLAEELERPVEIAAVEREPDRLAPRLGVVVAGGHRLLQLLGGLGGTAQPPHGACRCA